MKSIMNNVLHYVMSRVRTGFGSKTEKLAVFLETFRQGDKVGFVRISNFTLRNKRTHQLLVLQSSTVSPNQG